MRPQCVTIQMKAIEQYIRVALFVMLYKVFRTFKSVDETLVYDHSNESYWAILSCGTVCYAVQGVSNFQVCGWNPSMWPFKWKLLSSTFMWCCLLCCSSLPWHSSVWGDQIYLFRQTAAGCSPTYLVFPTRRNESFPESMSSLWMKP